MAWIEVNGGQRSLAFDRANNRCTISTYYNVVNYNFTPINVEKCYSWDRYFNIIR